MAIALDATSGVTYVATGTSASLSHTCSGSDRVLFVGVVGQITTDIITSVTYNGVAMTLVDKILCPSDRYIYLYYLIAPATGAHNITVTASSSTDLAFGGVSYTGADQTSPIDGSGKSTASTTTSITSTITTAVNNDWIISFFRNDGSAMSAGTSTTSRGLTTGAGQFARNMDSNGTRSAGSNSLQATSGSNANWAYVSAGIKPVGGVPAQKGGFFLAMAR